MADLKMPKINKVMMAGRLTRNPEVRDVGGTKLCKLGMAVSDKYKTKSGEEKEETVFINVTVWGGGAEYCGKYLKKGYPVLVTGSITQNEWQDATSGETKRVLEIKADMYGGVQQLTFENSNAGGGEQKDEPEVDNVAGDELPF